MGSDVCIHRFDPPSVLLDLSWTNPARLGASLHAIDRLRDEIDAQAGGAIAKQVKPEFGALTDTQAFGAHGVTALLTQNPAVGLANACGGLRANVAALKIKRTLWGKATTLHSEHLRPSELPIRDGFAHHCAALEALWRHPSRAKALLGERSARGRGAPKSRFVASARTHCATA